MLNNLGESGASISASTQRPQISRPMLLPFVLLLLFLLIGSINLGQPSVKESFGVDLNGIRLILFLFTAIILVVLHGKIQMWALLFFLTIIFFLIQLPWSLGSGDGIRLLLKLAVFPAVLFLSYRLDDRDVGRLIQVLMLVYLAHYGYMPYFFLHGEWLLSEGMRYPGLTGTRTVFGTYSVLVFFAALLFARKGALKNIVLLFSLSGIFISGSRLAFLELLIALGLLFFLRGKKHLSIGRTFFLILLIITVFSIMGSTLIARIGVTFSGGEVEFVGTGGGTLTHRLSMWGLLLDYWWQHNIWLGSGLGSSTEILRENPEISISMLVPHNEYIRILVDTGVVGAFFFFGLLLYLFIRLIITKSAGAIFILILFLDFIGTNTLDFYFEVYGLSAFLCCVGLRRHGRDLLRYDGVFRCR